MRQPKQTSPATYEIQENENGCFIYLNEKRTSITYNPRLDILTIPKLGNYIKSQQLITMNVFDNKSP